ncbi:hypothetical protein L7F22_046865 [Adiantum nelumboides]|nr:hypothetical protein [Adiantum nelumboides]
MVAESWRWLQLRRATRYTFFRFFNEGRAELSRWEHLFSKPGSVTAIAAELRQLGKARSLNDGKLFHACIRARNLDMYTFIGNCLIEMYANCGSLGDALHSFECMPNPNVYSWNMLIKAYCQHGSVLEAYHLFFSMPLKDSVSWNTMISSFAQHGHSNEALDLFNKMIEERFVPNNISYISALDACANSLDLHKGQEIHTSIIVVGYDKDVQIGTALFNAYGKCKKLYDAINVFDKLPIRDIISWNAMVSVCLQMNCRRQALHLFQRMVGDGFMPDTVSFLCVLEAGALEEGQVVHSFIVESCQDQGLEVCTALLTMYGNNGSSLDAWNVFQTMKSWTTVCWNAMIAVWTHNSNGSKAVTLCKRMCLVGFEPDKATFTSVVDACADQAALEEGQNVHAAIMYYHHEEDTLLCNALISFYAECGSVCDACRVFDRIPCRDAVSWTAIINKEHIASNIMSTFMFA